MQILKLLLIAVLSSLLFACAMFNHGGTNAKGNGPQTKGLGIGPDFNGQAGQYTQQQLLAQKTVLFNFDKTKVQKHYDQMLAAHAKYLNRHPNQVVLLAGNTDEQGSREYNMGLGQRRARSVESILSADGVPAAQLKKVSYGPEIPVACGTDQAAYAQNRRVDILYCGSSNCKKVAKRYARKL